MVPQSDLNRMGDMISKLQDALLRALSPRRFPAHTLSLPLPPGVEVRVNGWLLEINGRLVGIGTPLAGCASRTILVHPRLLTAPAAVVEAVISHELVHVEQFRRWGVLGVYWRYLRDLVRFGYHQNSLEREARGEWPG
jgi:hypothetical protein